MNINTNTKIGPKIKQLRLARNLSLNDLARLSGISKTALSKLEMGDSNPRIDTLEAIASALRFPLGDLFTSQYEEYPCHIAKIPMIGDYAQQFKFRINMGNTSEIWQLNMKRGAVINRPAHMGGSREHIMLHSGTLMLRLKDEQSILLEPGEFYAFACNFPHSYICIEGDVAASILMSYSHLGHATA